MRIGRLVPVNERTRGRFLAVEGGDGAGKTTQIDLLEAWLTEQGLACDRTREPGGTPVGEKIRSLLLEHGQGEIDPRTEALLFAASRAAHVVQRIEPALQAGTWVLTDRYVDSSVAYQGLGRELGTEAVAQVNDWAIGGLQPDLTIVLDLDPAVARERMAARGDGRADRMESAGEEFHARLRTAFLDRAAADPHRYLVVDAAQDPQTVQAQIRARTEELLHG